MVYESAVNHRPLMDSLDDCELSEGTEKTLALSAQDKDGDQVAFCEGPGWPRFAVLKDYGNGIGAVVLMPGFDDAGVYSLSVIVDEYAPDGTLRDDKSACAINSLITVTEGNKPPAIQPMPDIIVRENQTAFGDIVATDDDAPEGVQIPVTVKGLPRFAEVDGKQIRVRPGFSDAGTYAFTVEATDALDPSITVSRRGTITVVDVNRPPIMGPVGLIKVAEGETQTVPLAATDPDGAASLVFHAEGLPSFAVLTDAGIALSPGYDDAGSYGITLWAEEKETFAASPRVPCTVYVENTYRPPVVEGIKDIVLTEGETRMNMLRAYDPDVPDRTIIIKDRKMPRFCTLAGNYIVLSPKAGDAGTYEALFMAQTVFNSRLTTPYSLNITVLPVTRYTVRGNVTARDGTALSDVAIECNRRLYYSDAAGGFIIEGVIPGTYTLSARKAGYIFTPEKTTVTVRDADEKITVCGVTGSLLRIQQPLRRSRISGITIPVVSGSGQGEMPAVVLVNGVKARVMQDYVNERDDAYTFAAFDVPYEAGHDADASVEAVAFDGKKHILAKDEIEIRVEG